MKLGAVLLIGAMAWAQTPADELDKHFDLAVQYSIEGKDELAIPEYRKVLELAPDLYEAHINFGQVLLRGKQPAEALPHLKRAHEQKPFEFKPVYFLAETQFDLGQYADAVQSYAAAAKLDEKSAASELGWGRSLARMDRRTEALPHYRKAVEVEPELKSFLLELAQAHEDKGEAEQAIALYREFPENPAATERVGLLLMRNGNAKEAIDALESAVQGSPTLANQTALAQAYVKQNQPAKAEPLVAKVVAAEPQNFELRMYYARILRDQRKTAEAARQFQEAARIRPEAAEAWSELSGMLILAEQYPQALAALDKVKELGAENAGHMFFRATTLDRLNLKKEALDYYRKFLETSRTNPDQEFQARQRVKLLERETGKR